jgi:AAA domain
MLSPDHGIDKSAREFLELILPEQGPYVAFIVDATRKSNVFNSTLEELWQKIKTADAAGGTAYHGCAGYKEVRYDPRGTPPAERRYGRTKRNARGAKALWLDVDAGPGKPYLDWKAAAGAVAEFCRATGLPPPIIVLSGLGIHAYWPLLQMLDPETWGRYARGLKALCVKYGLHADPARTADITSVLRTPGTHHRKAGERLVQCSKLVGPYALDRFEILLSVRSEATAKSSNFLKPKGSNILNFGPLPPYLADRPFEGVGRTLLRSLATRFDPSFAGPIAGQCEQVRMLRDTRGNLPEPLWYSCLGVLAFAQDGERFAHEWSSGYKRYTEQETQERLERSRQFAPTTCARFQELEPAVCERCPWRGKIKSPIVVGRRRDQAQCEGGESSEDNFDREHSGHTETNQQEKQDRTNQRYQQDQANEQTQTGQTGQERKDKNSSGAKTQSAFGLKWHGEENPDDKRRWLVKHLLPEIGAGLISGQWGTAKTFVAIDLSVCVMTGNRFAGRLIKRKGGVLFIAAEGAVEIPIRLCGLVETKFPGHKSKLPFAWAESCPMLLATGAIDQLARIATEAANYMKVEFGVDLVLIIIDTMSAAAGFKDENSSAEGQVVMNILNELSRRTGAFAMACDHFGKVIETGTRGTSAKEASADAIIACLGDKTLAGNATNLRIAVRKVRGGTTGAETSFRLRTVDMGVDEDGEPITTCVVEWSQVTIAAPPGTAKGKGWPRSTLKFRAALVTTLELHGVEQRPAPKGAAVLAVELEEVRQEFNKRCPIDDHEREKQLASRRQTFKRSMNSAEQKGLVGILEIDGKFMVWLTRPEEEGISPPNASSGQQAA